MADARVEVIDRTVAFEGFFRIVRYRLRYRRFAGGMSPELVREVFARGAAVAVLPYDPQRDLVVLVEQFRAGALEWPLDPWLLEPVAGIVEPGEGAPEVARREAIEEAGLELLDLAPVAGFFPSPGGSDEVCETFIGRIDDPGNGGLFGLAEHGEDIRTHVVPFETALAWLGSGRLRVASTIITLQWLALHRAELRARWGAGDILAESA
jgi:ADP-ribose pyrophosphatase